MLKREIWGMVYTELIDTLWNVNDISHYEPVKDWDTN